jgi:hypothetical protein
VEAKNKASPLPRKKEAMLPQQERSLSPVGSPVIKLKKTPYCKNCKKKGHITDDCQHVCKAYCKSCVYNIYSGSKNRPNVWLFWKDELTTNQEDSVKM